MGYSSIKSCAYHDQNDIIITDLFRYSYESYLITGTFHVKRKEACPILYFHVRDIEGVHLINNSTFGDFVDRVCPIGLEIKDTGYTVEACFIPSQTDINCSL